MTPENFCYWLQGFYELKEANSEALDLSAGQSLMVREHLSLVMENVTGANPTTAGADNYSIGPIVC